MLQDALAALNGGEAFEAKILLRDFINATVGFTELGEAIGRDPKSLMRTFSPRGNPTLETLSDVLRELSQREGYVVKVEIPGASTSTPRATARTRKARAA
jgi:DNA-binding phage protein